MSRSPSRSSSLDSSAQALGVKIAGIEAMIEEGRAAQARLALQPLLTRRPGDPRLNMLMRNILWRQGEHQQALYYAERAAKAAPESAAAANLVGNSLIDLGRFDDAAGALSKAVALEPAHAVSHAALANALGRAGRYVEAEAAARKAFEIDPDHPRACGVLASILLHTGRADEALPILRRGVLRNPDDISTFSLMCSAYLYSDAPAREISASHFAFGTKLAELMPPARHTFPQGRETDRRLRIAFVAPDFRAHASAFFVEPFLERFDRERFEVCLWHYNPVEDAVSARLKAYPGVRWVNAGALAPSALAKRLRDDRTDIALDLAGHTFGNCLLAMHLRGAPVQAAWLAYPSTTGVRAMDWRLADSATDPEGFEKQGSERLWRLDPCVFAYRPPVDAASLPVPGEPPSVANGCVTFGCFSSGPKLNERMLRRSSRVLRGVPGSRLLIKNAMLARPETREWFRRRAEANGLPGDRLMIEEPAPTATDLIGHYARVDIALDTHPYAGNTTVAEALLMGVPVVTQTGGTSASRGAVPHLRAVGLDDLITDDEDSYIEAVVRLATDHARRAELRRTLRERFLGSFVCDEAGWTRRFETALRQMWREWCERGV